MGHTSRIHENIRRKHSKGTGKIPGGEAKGCYSLVFRSFVAFAGEFDLKCFDRDGIWEIYLQAVDRGDAYPSEIGSSVAAVMKELNMCNPYCLTWQSKVGPLRWLQPFTEEAIKGYVKQGKKNFILVPIAFVNEHIETLHELDIEYCHELAEEVSVVVCLRESSNSQISSSGWCRENWTSSRTKWSSLVHIRFGWSRFNPFEIGRQCLTQVPDAVPGLQESQMLWKQEMVFIAVCLRGRKFLEWLWSWQATDRSVFEQTNAIIVVIHKLGCRHFSFHYYFFSTNCLINNNFEWVELGCLRSSQLSPCAITQGPFNALSRWQIDNSIWGYQKICCGFCQLRRKNNFKASCCDGGYCAVSIAQGVFLSSFVNLKPRVDQIGPSQSQTGD